MRISPILVLPSMVPMGAAELKIDSLPLRSLSSGWGKPQPGKSISGGPLKVGGTQYKHGVGTHAPSTLLLTLDGKATRFEASVGVDDFAAANRALVEFKLIGDSPTSGSIPRNPISCTNSGAAKHSALLLTASTWPRSIRWDCNPSPFAN